MKATLKTFTALTVVLALSGEAGAQSNFSPMMKPNLTNLVKPNLVKPNLVKPPMIISNGVKPINPNAVKPIVRPQIVRPAIAPRVDTDRLAKAIAQGRPVFPKPGKQRAPGSDPAPESNGPKQAGTPIVSIRELPPLPRPKPDRQVIAELPPLPRSKPHYNAGPQPEPPTLETNAGASGLPGSDNGAPGEVGNVAGLEAVRDILGDVALGQELARLGDLRDLLGGNDAIDNGAIGGGGSGKHSSSRWLGLVPESNTGDAGPQNDQVWKPEAPGDSAYNRDPSGDQGGAFTPPARGKRDGSNIRGFGQTPGSAGAGLRFGNDGTTSQDPVPSEGADTSSDADADNDGHDPFRDSNAGAMAEAGGELIEDGFDGEKDHVAVQVVRAITAPLWLGQAVLLGFAIDSALQPVGPWGPDSQPNPEEAGSGQSLPCPHTSTGCGPSDGPMSYQPSKWDKVGQPGRGENDEPSQGFTASVTERKNVVSQPNPADSGGGPRGGGGADGLPECHPICHVTGGGGGPGGPARP